jgi:hypothetical protein
MHPAVPGAVVELVVERDGGVTLSVGRRDDIRSGEIVVAEEAASAARLTSSGGAFDLAVSRFSGRRAPPRRGLIERIAYDEEVCSLGFWPGESTYDTGATLAKWDLAALAFP